MNVQPVYQPRPDDLDRKLRALFPSDAGRDAARELLNTYGTEAWHREADRVRLAILYLARDDLDEVAAWVEEASVDYRDVLAAAEYPSLMTLAPGIEPASEEYVAALEADAKRYREWVDSWFR